MVTYLQDFMQAAAKHPIDPNFINQNAKQLMDEDLSIQQLNHELSQLLNFSFENVIKDWSAADMIDIYDLILSTITHPLKHQFMLSQFEDDATINERLQKIINDGMSVKELRANTIFVRNVFLDLNYCKDFHHFTHNLNLNGSLHESLLAGGDLAW
jgi:DNA-binding protein Fis